MMNRHPRVVAISQARMGSTRLPGKVMKEICGLPLLEHHLSRVSQSRLVSEVLVATTTLPTDDAISDWCKRQNIRCFRGDEQDVLSRYTGAARAANADVVVRVTSDCPMIDPEVIDSIIERYLSGKGKWDYVSNTRTRSYPRGLDAEVFSRNALEVANDESHDAEEREHVTPFIYWRPERFAIDQLVNAQDLSQYRWTVDTSEDYQLIQLLIGALYPSNPNYRMRDVLNLLDRHPDWLAINAHIEQKSLSR